jgi:hypothetical protein
METEIVYVSSDRTAKILAWTVVGIMFLVYYTLMAVYAPLKKMEALKNEYVYRYDDNNPVDERIFTDSAYLDLLHEKSFLQSRVAMAATDSVYLSINLSDSTINLEISGVTVHKTQIGRISASKILVGGNNYIVLSMLSDPLIIKKNFSSIRKEPLMIKMAPRDTSEYVPDIIPDTADYEPVNYILEMENGIRLHVYQEDKLKLGDGLCRSLFDIYHRFRYTAKTFWRVIAFRLPDYQPYIKLRIPRSDAKIIYRALPEKGQIAVYS